MPKSNVQKRSATRGARTPYGPITPGELRARDRINAAAFNDHHVAEWTLRFPKPGDRVKVRVTLKGKEEWKDGVVNKYLSPLNITVTKEEVNGIAPQFPVRFRLHLQGPQIMKRFFPWEIKLAEEKQDENTEPR